jgi:hypothetical protein
LLPVASLAVQFCVLAIQGKSGAARMIEALLVKPREFEISAMMLFVAFHTLMSCQRRMISRSRRHPVLDLLMAFETFAIRERPADVMAGGALANPFQTGVSCGEFSGRDLGDEQAMPDSSQQYSRQCNSMRSQKIHRYPNASDTAT